MNDFIYLISTLILQSKMIYIKENISITNIYKINEVTQTLESFTKNTKIKKFSSNCISYIGNTTYHFTLSTK